MGTLTAKASGWIGEHAVETRTGLGGVAMVAWGDVFFTLARTGAVAVVMSLGEVALLHATGCCSGDTAALTDAAG